jgi:hypothetical protein
MCFGTWNLRTLLQAENMNAIADEAERYKMDVVALEEICWKGKGLIRKSKFNIYYCGNEDRSRFYCLQENQQISVGIFTYM